MKTVPVWHRSLTNSLAPYTVSDICFRSAPIDRFMRKEILRICMRSARLTYVTGFFGVIDGLEDYFRSIGTIEDNGLVVLFEGNVMKKDMAFALVRVLNVVGKPTRRFSDFGR